MEKNLKKIKCMNDISQAIGNAIKSGFVVAVASDDEGNSYNYLNPIKYPMLYSDEELSDKAIVLGVYGAVEDEDELFKPIKICSKCISVITKNKDGEWESETQTNGRELCYGCSSANLENNNK